MGTGSFVIVRPDMVEDVLNRFKDQISALEALHNEVLNLRHDISDAWSGEDADAFLSEVETKVKSDFANALNAILPIAGIVSKMIDTAHTTDDKCVKIFEELEDIARRIYP
jgi:hypothetical protein